MAEYELGNVHPLHLVHLHWDACSVVHDRDGIGFGVDRHFDRVHGGVTHFVVSGVDQDLVKDLVEARHEGDGLLDHLLVHHHPHGLLLVLCAADVGVRAQQDVLELGHLLVNLLDRAPVIGLRVACGGHEGLPGLGRGLCLALALRRSEQHSQHWVSQHPMPRWTEEIRQD